MYNQELFGSKHKVTPLALYGCGLCHNPAPYMCKACRGEGVEIDEACHTAKQSINGCNVPADFMYV